MFLKNLAIAIPLLFNAVSLPLNEPNSGYVPNNTAWWFCGGGGAATTFEEERIKNVLPGMDPNANLRIPNNGSQAGTEYITDCFTLDGNNVVSFSFSPVMYDELGNQINGSDWGNTCFDVRLFDADTQTRLSNLCIWFDSGGPSVNNQSLQIGVGAPTADNNHRTDYNCEKWIHGKAQASSEFYIAFSKENLWESFVGEQGTEYARLDSSTKDVLQTLKPLVQDVHSIFFEICGFHGWKSEATIYVNEIMNQKLGAVDNNKIYDETAPKILELTKVPSSIELNKPYKFDYKAIDLLSEPRLQAYVDEIEVTSLTYTPTQAGQHKVKFVATDSVGNESTKEVVFNVVGNIEEPTIISVPEIDDFSIYIGDTKIIPAPEYYDGGTDCELTLLLTKETSTTTIAFDSTANGFPLTFTDSKDSGEYSFVFKVTNVKGSDESDPINVKIEVIKSLVPDFVEADQGLNVSITSTGVRGNSESNYKKMSFGVFDIGLFDIDVKYIIPRTTRTGVTNDVHYFDFQILNVDNSDYWIMYRVWCGEYVDNDSCPTNMYINSGTPGNTQCVDYSDCGWITRYVDSVDGQFHMHININEGFSAEFNREMVGAANTLAPVQEFFSAAPSTKYKVLFYTAGIDESAHNMEFIVSEINNQNFENEGNVFTNIISPQVKVLSLLDSVYKVDNVVNVSAYIKNVFKLSPELRYNFVETDSKYKQNIRKITNEDVSYSSDINVKMPSEPGYYKLKIYTPYYNSMGTLLEGGQVINIEVKDKIASIDINISGSYQSSYLPTDSITVYDATYSNNVVFHNISLTFNGETKEVQPGDKIVFEKAGIYSLAYYARDDANPTFNENTKYIYLNVVDVVDPVVEIEVKGSLRAEERVDVIINVSDDTACDIYIIFIDNNNLKTLYTTNKFSFAPKEMGKYYVSARVEDAYGNVGVAEKEITIIEKAPNQVLISWIVIGSLLGVVVVAFITYTTVDSIKRKKGKVK